MQISGYSAAQAAGLTRPERAAARSSGGFEKVLGNKLGQKEQASLPTATKAAQASPLQAAQAAFVLAAHTGQAQAEPSQAGVLSASEKNFFNDSFGTNVFGADAAKASGPVVSKQGASVLDSQEISFFQGAFGIGSKAGNSHSSSYIQGTAFSGVLGQSAQAGASLNRTV